MLDTLIKSFAPRVVQDLITSLVALLAAHGYITADQTQSTIGSLFFLAMLIVNYFIGQKRKADAAVAGAASTGAVLTTDVIATAKNAGKKP